MERAATAWIAISEQERSVAHREPLCEPECTRRVAAASSATSADATKHYLEQCPS